MRLGQNFWGKKIIQLSLFILLGTYLNADPAKSHEAAKRIGGEMIGFVMSLSVFDIVFSKVAGCQPEPSFSFTLLNKNYWKGVSIAKDLPKEKTNCKVFVERSTPNALFACG